MPGKSDDDLVVRVTLRCLCSPNIFNENFMKIL